MYNLPRNLCTTSETSKMCLVINMYIRECLQNFINLTPIFKILVSFQSNSYLDQQVISKWTNQWKRIYVLFVFVKIFCAAYQICTFTGHRTKNFTIQRQAARFVSTQHCSSKRVNPVCQQHFHSIVWSIEGIISELWAREDRGTAKKPACFLDRFVR